MNVAVILAGGIGSRVGAEIPKQFIEVLGKPVLAYTIEPFEKHPDIDAILVVCVEPYMDFIWHMKEKYGFSKVRWVTQGGDTFQKSVLNGVNYLEGKINSDDTVLFHFGASPFVTSDIIEDAIKICKVNGTNAISATDFYLLSGEKNDTTSVNNLCNYTDKYINRDSIAVMNTPHAFQYGFISELYKEAIRSGLIDTVEPHTTTLMYAMGKRIFFSKGSQTNIKITTKEDLTLFEGYVLEQQRKNDETVEGDVVVFLADGFEECEALLVVDILRRAGLKVIVASIMGRRDVKSSREILIYADCLVENVDYKNAKLIVLPGGRLGIEELNKSELVKKICLECSKEKYIAAVCAAPTILASIGLLDGKKATVHPDYKKKMSNAILEDEGVVVDNNIITGQGLGASMDFAFVLVEKLAGLDVVNTIKRSIYYKY